MKLSVLIPTRNRLNLLKFAVETVQRQDYDDWEIIISDNCSEEDIAGYVRSLEDARIKYFRTETFIPVTENWNKALHHSSGDYFIMLGDDDCMMQGALSTLSRLTDAYGNPDFIYMRAFLYAYPGVLPDYPDGLLRTNGCAEFFARSDEPFFLMKPEALRLVRKSMNIRLPFDFNMQYSVVNRKFANSLRGAFFQSPYPDYYATNVLFLKATRILVCPLPLVTIGVSPKSFGFFYFNDREAQGVEFLMNLSDPEISGPLEPVLLPGSNMNNSWLISMETIRTQYGSEFDLEVNHRRYRTQQVLYAYESWLRNGREKGNLRQFWRHFGYWERLSYKVRLWITYRLSPHLRDPKLIRLLREATGLANPYPDFAPPHCSHHFTTILEVFEQVTPELGLRHAWKRSPKRGKNC